MTLTPEQRAAAIEAMARAMCAPFPPNELIFLGGYMTRWKSHKEAATLALDAALPTIEAALVSDKPGGDNG